MPTNQSVTVIPYGGQALIEGVMMKAKSYVTLALRNKDQSISLIRKAFKSSVPEFIRNTPFFRGFFLLVDMFGVGLWGLNYSSEHYVKEYLEDKDTNKKETINAFTFTLLTIISIVAAIAIFKLLPTYLTDVTQKLINLSVEQFRFTPLTQNIIEGLIRMFIFFGYVLLIGLLPDVQRVFAYHGAEHTAVNALENNPNEFNKLEFAKNFDTLHYRCGTSFIVFVIVISIIVYGLIDSALVPLAHNLEWINASQNTPPLWLRAIVRIISIPIIIGIAYEITKNVYFLKNTIFRPLLEFGMLFQRLTTRKPSADQLEVALAALIDVRNQVEGLTIAQNVNIREIITIDNPNSTQAELQPVTTTEVKSDGH